jgi:hypothetical protein
VVLIKTLFYLGVNMKKYNIYMNEKKIDSIVADDKTSDIKVLAEWIYDALEGSKVQVSKDGTFKANGDSFRIERVK